MTKEQRIIEKQDELIKLWKFYADDISADDYKRIEMLQEELALLKSEEGEVGDEAIEVTDEDIANAACTKENDYFHFDPKPKPHEHKPDCITEIKEEKTGEYEYGYVGYNREGKKLFTYRKDSVNVEYFTD